MEGDLGRTCLVSQHLDHVYLRHLSTEYRSILSADISTDINRSVMGENDEVLGPAGEGRDDGSYKIDANLLLSKKKKKLKFFYVNYICFQLSTFIFIYYLTKEKYKMVASRK